MAFLRHVGYLGWMLVALAAQCVASLVSVLSRWLTVKAQPPLPSTRLALLSVLLSMATLIVCHGIPFTLIRTLRWYKARRRQQGASKAVQLADECPSGAAEDGTGKPAALQKGQQQKQQQLQQHPPQQARHAGKRVQTGLSRRLGSLRLRHPRLFLAVFMASLSIFSALSLTMITIAPSYVDPSIVQLIQLFSVILIALLQWAAAGLRPPWLMWPAAMGMIAGACMIVVPNIGSSASGSLSGEGWLGFGLSIVALLSAVMMMVLLQASRNVFSVALTQYWMNVSAVTIVACVSLPKDGVDWSGQFMGWTTTDWAILCVLGCFCFLGAGVLAQLAVWFLGASTVAMLVGLRLVLAIGLSKAILSATIIDDGVQIAGCVVTVCSVTAYMAYLWWQERAAKAAAGELEPTESAADIGDEEAPPLDADGKPCKEGASDECEESGTLSAVAAGEAAAEQALRMGIPTQTSLVRRMVVDD